MLLQSYWIADGNYSKTVKAFRWASGDSVSGAFDSFLGGRGGCLKICLNNMG